MASFKYQLIRKGGFISSISIRVTSEKGVIVRAPFWMPVALIENFLKEKTEWIQKNLKKIKRKKVVKRYIEGEKHLYFGKYYPLQITKVNSPGRRKVSLQDDKIVIEIYKEVPEKNIPQSIKDGLLYWYLEKGIEALTEKVNYYSDKIGVSYKNINLKKVSTIWGSCSPSNGLSFNRKLIMAPHEVVDYVVIHEVAHMVHRNHGREFWQLVANFDPNFKINRKWLRQNHHLLAI